LLGASHPHGPRAGREWGSEQGLLWQAGARRAPTALSYGNGAAHRGQWRAWYARFRSLITSHAAWEDKAGTFARRLQREGESLWVFLDVPGVEATNNIAERAHRFGGLWRKRSQGTCSEKGNRWGERVLSFRHTCRIRGRPTFPILVEAVTCLFTGKVPDLRWITQQESLPAYSTL
jgi:hypothetical protein